MQIQNIPTENLVEYARNPRKNDAVVDKMVACIKEFGFRIPIVAKSDGTVVDGHLRLKAARKLGLKEVPVVNADDLTEAQIKAFRLVANQSANWADWDEELLKLEFKDLEDLNYDLELTGFDLEDIQRQLDVLDGKSIEEDSDEEIQNEDIKQIITKAGDIWLLGDHRLMCGNSVLIDDVERLIEGKKADMVFTDPPYNVKVSNISGVGKDAKDKHEEFVMASGEMSEEEFIQFLTDVFINLAAVSKDGSIHYVCMDWKHIYEIITAGRKAYTEFKQLCVWNKDNGGMGTFYRSKHELIFVFKHGTASHTNNFGLGENGRYRTNVWEYAGMGSLANKDRDELLKMHPTVKPLALIADAILDCSNRNELILDLFGGSGTTLMAAEKVGRKCCMMEMSPKYCDTIVRRWQKLTGQQAILESTGKTFDSLIEAEE